MCKRLCLMVLIAMTVLPLNADDFTKALIKEFKDAGVSLRLDKDESLRSDMKLFDGFVRDPEKAFKCNITTAMGKKPEGDSLVFFQIRENGELRQVYTGRLVMKRRHKKTGPEDRAHTRLIMKAEERASGKKICDSGAEADGLDPERVD